jgi:hypothetical protein
MPGGKGKGKGAPVSTVSGGTATSPKPDFLELVPLFDESKQFLKKVETVDKSSPQVSSEYLVEKQALAAEEIEKAQRVLALQRKRDQARLTSKGKGRVTGNSRSKGGVGAGEGKDIGGAPAARGKARIAELDTPDPRPGLGEWRKRAPDGLGNSFPAHAHSFPVGHSGHIKSAGLSKFRLAGQKVVKQNRFELRARQKKQRRMQQVVQDAMAAARAAKAAAAGGRPAANTGPTEALSAADEAEATRVKLEERALRKVSASSRFMAFITVTRC